MAETLTSIESTPEAGELNADEQNSLEVGEQLAQEQETLLAGKYGSAEQLEQAYLELQQKLGGDQEGEADDDQSDESEEYSDDDGQDYEEGPGGLSDDDVEALQDMVGGEQQYGEMIAWAAENMSEPEIEMYDEVMDSGDPAACFFAVQALMSRYNDSTGVDGELLTGKSPTVVAQGFRSQAELVEAMSDPRYDADPAYRADVINKLENSEIDF